MRDALIGGGVVRGEMRGRSGSIWVGSPGRSAGPCALALVTRATGRLKIGREPASPEPLWRLPRIGANSGLSSAQLSSAQLSSAQLSSARLGSAQLSSAQLSSAQGPEIDPEFSLFPKLRIRAL